VTTASFVALVSRYGLLAVFGGSLIEGEGILIVAATLSEQGVLDPVRVWLAASTGAWLGHLFWFTTGRFEGADSPRVLRPSGPVPPRSSG